MSFEPFPCVREVYVFGDKNLSEGWCAYDLIASSEEVLFRELERIYGRDRRSAEVLGLFVTKSPVVVIPTKYVPSKDAHLCRWYYKGYFCASEAEKMEKEQAR